MIEGAKRDKRTMNAQWEWTKPIIEGVSVKRTRNIITASSVTTELFRRDWNETGYALDHAIYVHLHPNSISAWHCHTKQTDGIFVIHGMIKLVLFDDREDSVTMGQINEFRLGGVDPCLVTVPPLVWHGLQNLQNDSSSFLNMFDHAYCYDNPDEWRLPADTGKIPYSF